MIKKHLKDLKWAFIGVFILVSLLLIKLLIRNEKNTSQGPAHIFNTIINNVSSGNTFFTLSLFIVSVTWIMFWEQKYGAYVEKEYPKTDKKIQYRGGLRLLGAINAFETIKNSHPDDKRYTFYCNMKRTGLVLIIALFVIMFMYR